jgi:hypothetical protein
MAATSSVTLGAFAAPLPQFDPPFDMGPRWGMSRPRLHVVQEAAAQGRHDVIEWAIRNGCGREDWACASAAGAGRTETVRWLREKGYTYNGQELMEAVRSGDRATISWLLANDCKWTGNECDYLDDKDLVKWMHSQGCPLGTCARGFAKQGDTNMLAWVLENGGRFDGETYLYAAEGNQLATIDWMRAHGIEWGQELHYGAASKGHLAIMEYVESKGLAPTDPLIAATATRNGHLEVLKWLAAKKYPFDTEVSARAIMSEHKEIATWVIESKLPCAERTCMAAASTGDLELLKRLRADGYAWDSATIVYSIKKHPECAVWAWQNGCPDIEADEDEDIQKLMAEMRAQHPRP